MPKKNTISITIVAYNEQAKLKECLQSCSWADEIVVINAGSTDKTADIAKKMKAKVYTVENQPLMKINMNLSFEKCTSNWIFSLDADERITPELQKEIKQVIKSKNKHSAYQIPRKNIIFGKWITHTGWYPDYQIRLFKKGKAKFPAKNVHELLEVNGSTGTLTSDIEHLHYETVSQFISKLNSYTDVEADKLIKEGHSINWQDAVNFPKEEFLNRFFAHEGYKDAMHGYVLSSFMAFYWEVVFAKIWEKKGFNNITPDNFLTKLVTEAKRASKDAKYWIYTTLMRESKTKRIYYKILRKFR